MAIKLSSGRTWDTLNDSEFQTLLIIRNIGVAAVNFQLLKENHIADILNGIPWEK